MRSLAYTASRNTKRRLQDEATLTERTLMVALDAAGERYSFQYVVETPEAMGGFFVVDFFLPRRRLLVELDGSQHFRELGRWADRLRTEAIERARPRLLLVRFANSDVTKDAAGLVRYLRSF